MPTGDLVSHAVLEVARRHQFQFTQEFLDYLPENLHVWEAFEREALLVARKGFKHYSARTIIHVLRHHSALTEAGGEWKLNNNISPYLARLFALVHPGHASLFEFREAKAVRMRPAMGMGAVAA